MKGLSREFYTRDAASVARDLLGKGLYKRHGDIWVGGTIVETEAYLHETDEASHSYRGVTKRNEAMFMHGGVAYVYFIYGNHFCFNVVTGSAGSGEAVLIRALEPVKGIEAMQQRRGTDHLLNLCSGPGKLCKALGIDKSDNGKSLAGAGLLISGGISVADEDICATGRVGISAAKEMMLRFYIRKSSFVSKSRQNFV